MAGSVGLHHRTVPPREAAQRPPKRRFRRSYIAGELGANAVCHTGSGRGGQFSVEVAWTGSAVSIVVGDSGGPAEPRVIDDLESENGRGLQLVRALSLTVGVTGDERGRFVRADVPWTANRRSMPRELAWDRETAADLRML